MRLKKWRSPIFEKNSLDQNNLPKFGVFGQFLEFKSLDLSNFAYYDRQAYLADTGGPVAEKNFPAQIWGHLGPNLAQNWVFGKYLSLDSYNLSDIANSGWFQWYFTNGGYLCSKILAQN